MNAITDVFLQVVVPERPRSPDDVATAIDSKRYPGLKASDLPCLWVEGGGGGHLVARLPADVPGVKSVLFGLVDAFRHAQNFPQAERLFSAARSPRPTPAAGHIVISLHGFNTPGAWQKWIQACFDEVKLGLEHRPDDYGHVGLRGLLNPVERTAEVQRFLQWYEALVYRANLHDSPPSVIAHSFGSYIVARAMEENPQVRFRRIVFCGSIVRRDYDWGARIESGQVERVLNEYSRRDIWARVAEWVIADGGSAGAKGFDNTAGGAVVQREYPFWRHSSYFYNLHQRESWMPFLARQRDPPVVVQGRQRVRNYRFYTFISALAALIGVAAWAVWRYVLAGG
ncbi:hypothetical protein [Aquincola sp. J276]|uniref:hypothetical protein n=1 Tax=Aquincola sp. J276 TaxID=2898432 RepID=UPI002150CDB8|nr:hypothetical protein [Aquincola sp. J276]MCR5868505.1 hypothetical protein [Aquincola sp. J276]